MTKLLCFLLCVPFFAPAQNKKGINFQETLTFEQIKSKAKSENKYVFIDCYATWCAPCKKMDKEVYSDDSVANYFNNKFISVKVQMDQTEDDNQTTKSWYQDAISIGTKYRIIAYPSYIFLNPDGIIVHKESGFKPPSAFMSIARFALSPGKVYNDPFARYDSLLMDYKQGKKNYAAMLYMIKASEKLRDTSINRELRRDYNDYLLNQEDQLYTKDNIEYISTFVNSKSRFFHLFYPDGKRVDKTMNKKGYSQNIVDEVVLYETVAPFLKIEIGGMQIEGGAAVKKPEPDWHQLFKKISSEYTEEYAERNVLEARILWNERQGNYSDWIKYFILKVKKYGIDTSNLKTDRALNRVAWEIFLRSTDKKLINTSLQWMEMIMKRLHNKPPSTKAAMTDTYASLLYKSGKTKEAIDWEEKALAIAISEVRSEPFIDDFKARLEQMKKGEPTWIVE